MIKKTIQSATLLVTLWTMCSCGVNKGFTLEGKIDGTNAEEIILAYDETTDTVEVVDGYFEFEGEVEEPTMAVLLIEGRQTSLMLENSDITFEGAIDALIESAIAGSESQLPFDTFIKENGKHSSSQSSYIEYCQKFCKENTGEYFTPYVIANVGGFITPSEVLEMIEALSPEVQKSKVSVSIKEQVMKLLAVSVGGQAPDFTMNDTEGNPVKLSDVYSKNKYTLIDFWASWCGPCRVENPNVAANYNEYKAKGFTVLGVSFDKDKAAWDKAIADDKLTWINVSDFKGWESEAAGLYKVQSIPSNFLVDNKGKIVAVNLREKELSQKLSELLD